MPKPYFALNLDVAGKPCLVVGGDEEALEKTQRLIEAQAKLTVVGRKVLPELAALCAQQGVVLHQRAFQDSDLDGMFFVLNCVKTDPAMSERIYRLGLERHAIVSAYDQPNFSNAVMSALVRAGRMRIAIASGGSTPGLTAALRRELERLLATPEFAEFSEWMVEQRDKLIAEGVGPKERKRITRKMLEDFAIEGKIRFPKAYLEAKAAR